MNTTIKYIFLSSTLKSKNNQYDISMKYFVYAVRCRENGTPIDIKYVGLMYPLRSKIADNTYLSPTTVSTEMVTTLHEFYEKE